MSSARARRALLSVVLAATSFALLAGPGAAAGEGDFCSSIGLTNATVRPILGSHVSVYPYPNAGQDIGDCLIYDLKSRNPNADVEVYPAGLAESLIADYGGGAKTQKHVKGLTGDAQLVTGKNNGYRHGGPTVFFTTGTSFVTVDGYPSATLIVGRHRHVKPATTAAQVVRLAELIYKTVK
jgi:hypothetical protein